MKRFAIPMVVLSLVVAACGGDGEDAADDGGETSSGAPAATDAVDADSGDSAPATVDLPAPCVLPPFTATVERTGESPAGSSSFGVVDTAVVPIPLVPDPNQELEFDEATERAATTDLLGYSMLIADEEIDDAGLGLFSGYEPEGEDAVRAFVAIYPSSPTPIAAGDVITYAVATELGMFTPLTTVGLDLKASADEFNSYLNEPTGHVTVLALSEDAACFDVDLSWRLSGSDGVVTIRGVFAGPATARPNVPLG